MPPHKLFQDLTGMRFGRLVVQSFAGERKNDRVWLCLCDCSNQKLAGGRVLRRGLTKSCGCLVTDTSKRLFTTHGLSKSPEYRAWRSMFDRCASKTEPSWSVYGSRGIVVCERWRKFENFIADMGPKPTVSHEVDRINGNGNYEPSNCRWVTPKQQNRNTRHNRRITFNGLTMCATEWAEHLGLPSNLVSSRLNNGWSEERALTQPKRRSPKRPC